MHEGDPAPSTYIGSENRRLDFILGCRTIADHTTRAGMLSWSKGPQWDHRGLFVDISFNDLVFVKSRQPFLDLSRRALHTGNSELVAKLLCATWHGNKDRRSLRQPLIFVARGGTEVADQMGLWSRAINVDIGKIHQHHTEEIPMVAKYRWSPSATPRFNDAIGNFVYARFTTTKNTTKHSRTGNEKSKTTIPLFSFLALNSLSKQFAYITTRQLDSSGGIKRRVSRYAWRRTRNFLNTMKMTIIQRPKTNQKERQG